MSRFKPTFRDRFWKFAAGPFKSDAEFDEDLHYAAVTNMLWRAEYLIEQKGADIHSSDNFCIRWAANGGHAEMISFLLEKGADVHAKDDEALIRAVARGKLPAIDVLVKAGAKPSAQKNKALLIAHKNKDIKIIETLLSSPEDLSEIAAVLKKDAFKLKNLSLEMTYMAYIHKRKAAPPAPKPPQP